MRGLDVHAETIVACVMTGNRDEDLFQETTTFPTLTKDLYHLLKWLEGHGSHPYCNEEHRCILEACI